MSSENSKGDDLIRKVIELRAGRRVRAIEMDVPLRRGGMREAKRFQTSLVQEQLNLKYAYQKFEFALYANFSPRDWLVELTYDDGHLPQQYDEAARRLKYFLRKLREARKARGEELRYLYVTEGMHGAGRMHHHIVINAGAEDHVALEALWKQGFVWYQRLSEFRGEGNTEGLHAVAMYLTKEPRKTGRLRLGQHMWTPSRGLRQAERREWELAPGEHYSPPTGAEAFPGSRCPERRENVFGTFYSYDFEVPIF